MRNRILVGAVVAAAGAFAAVPVVSGAATAPSRATLNITSRTTYQINRYAQDQMRFAKDVVTIKSGGTVTVVSKTPQEPHTVSIVRSSALPRTKSKIENCSICNGFFKAHQVKENPNGPPTIGKPLVNVGATGFNTAGDSIVINPGAKVSFKVTARPGTTLHFLCAVHPWMQARFDVK